MHARSPEGSKSPPTLAHFKKEGFFGSSFAASPLTSTHRTEQTNGVNLNTFALSSVNRVQAARNSNGGSHAQDKGPQNFRQLQMAVHQIPDQFKADLSRLQGHQHNSSANLETSFQQDEVEDEFAEGLARRIEFVDSREQTDQDTVIE